MSGAAPQGSLAGLRRIARLARKELAESLRDRRTTLTLILMPLLLYPILAMAFRQLLLTSKADKAQPKYRVAFASKEEADSVLEYWGIGRRHLVRRHAPADDPKGKASISAYLSPLPELDPFVTNDVAEVVRLGEVQVGVVLTPPQPFVADPKRLLFVNMELLYREGSTVGRDAIRHLEQLTSDANAVLVGSGLQVIKVPQRGDPVRVRANTVADATGKRASLLPVLVPLILILMTMTGAVYPAIDLTAGERERGTLEILVAAPISRLNVLLAKYVAVLTVAMLTALVNLGMMALTLYFTELGPEIFGTSITPGVLVQVLLLLLLFASFFSAVLLTLTSFARSFKEAQAYLIPLMLLCLAPGIMALLPGLSLGSSLAVVPLVNIVLLSRDVFEGTANPLTAGVVVLTTLVYALAALMLATRVFGTEAVLAGESSSVGDLLKRPAVPQPAAQPSGALLCLAVMFPLYFLAMSALGQLRELDFPTRMLLSSAAYVLLFVAIPLVAAWLGRVTVLSGLNLHSGRVPAFLVALLLGVSLWPFAHEGLLWLREVGAVTLPAGVAEATKKFLEAAREHSPLVLLLGMAVVPAVTEELFFRGYLQTALVNGSDRPARGIAAAASLFAIFHLFVGGAIAVERLPSSFLLGLALGWLAYKGGSVVPGMLLHALHNGLVLLLGYFEPSLVEAGWVSQDQEHLPGWLLGAAAVAAVAGGGWLVGMRRAKP